MPKPGPATEDPQIQTAPGERLSAEGGGSTRRGRLRVRLGSGTTVLALAVALLLAGGWLAPARDLPADSAPAAQAATHPPGASRGPGTHPAEGPTMAGARPRDGDAAPTDPRAGATLPATSVSAGATPVPTAAAASAGTPEPSRPLFSLRVPILTYHVIAPLSIAQPYASTDSDVVPERFDAQLATLQAAGWRTITADALADALEKSRPVPIRTFVIAIDDGHDDGFDFAFPVIRRHGFQATYYVIAGRVGTGTYLSWDEVRAMQSAGMEIGNHTLSHVPLPTLSPADVLREIAGGQAAFEAQLDRPPTTFAYPFGQFDDVAVKAVYATGLRLAFTTKAGMTQTWATRFLLPRVHVGGAMTAAQLLAVVSQFLPRGS